MNRIGVIAGSFDPITNGHTWLIKEALTIVDHLYIVVGNNPVKKYWFTESERMSMVVEVCNKITKVRNDTHMVTITTIDKQLLVTYAASVNANCLIRGIRNAEDFNYEAQMLLINRKIEPEMRTVFFIPPRELTEVSSSTVKGIVGYDGWKDIVAQYVDPLVLDQLERKQS